MATIMSSRKTMILFTSPGALGLAAPSGSPSPPHHVVTASAPFRCRRKGGGLPGVCGLTRRLALELRPAWRRATAGRDLRVFSKCVPHCRVRPALAVPCFLPPAVQGGSVGIRIAYSACFGPSLPRSNLHRSILGRFLQQYANCRVPVSRQVGDWCAICRRLVNHRSMDSLESVGAWPDGMVFGPERLAWGWHGNCAVAVGSGHGRRFTGGTAAQNVPEQATVGSRAGHGQWHDIRCR